jgi:hypothetical protein
MSFRPDIRESEKSPLFYTSVPSHPSRASFLSDNMIRGFNSGQSLTNPQHEPESSIAEGSVPVFKLF